jgi:hypothetical protein
MRAAVPGIGADDLHRIGGGSMVNLRLKPREARLNPPGISVLKAPSPGAAARQIREAFPKAAGIHEVAKVVGSTSAEKTRAAGFDVIPNPTRKLPNHYRIIHPDGAAGFSDENLEQLSAVFTDTSGH